MTGSPERRRRVPSLEAVAWLVVYAAGLVAAQAYGFRMAVPYFYFQLLSRELLSQRLGESLWNLHAQPPVVDLLLGAALKLARTTGAPVETLLLVLHAVLGGVIVLATLSLLRRLGLRLALRCVVMLLLLLDPDFYIFLGIFSYTFYELLLLTLAALAAHRFATRPTPQAYAACCLPIVLLVYTRALFHPLWALAALAGLAAGARAGQPAARRQVAAAFALSVLVLLAWPLKNGLRFGVWSYSSWQGFNLSRGLGIDPPAGWIFSMQASPAELADRAVADRRVPAAMRQIPVLTQARKQDGSLNWNHYAIIGMSAEMGRQALATWVHDPARVAGKAMRNYLVFTTYPGRNPYSGRLDWRTRQPVAVAWLAAYEWLSLAAPIRLAGTSPTPLFAFVFPILTVAGVRRAWTLRTSDRPAALTLAVLLGSALWVLAAVLLVDGEEGNRMRFSTQPALWVGAAAALEGWLRSRRQRNGRDAEARGEEQRDEPHRERQRPAVPEAGEPFPQLLSEHVRLPTVELQLTQVLLALFEVGP
jgi:hypothetical protein